MMQRLDRLEAIVDRQSGIIAGLTSNVTTLAEAAATLTTMMMDDARTKVQCAVKSFDGRGYV
jgi:hypothetical protein